MKVVHLGIGLIPVPPCDVAASTEADIYLLTYYLGQQGCQVHVIDIKGGAQQKEKRLKSSAVFHEAWHLPLPYRHNFPFWEPFFNYLAVTIPSTYFALSSSPVLYRLIGRENIEVIHTHTRETTIAAVIMNKLRRKTALTIYTPHSGYKLTKVSLRQRVFRITEILAFKWADHVVAQVPAAKDWLVSEFHLNPAKITQIYAGIGLDEVEQFLYRKVGPCHQANIVLCTGTIGARKNQFTAVKVISQVIKTHPDIKLVFTGPIGEGDYLQTIEKYIIQNNLSTHIEFKGEVSKQELFNLYSDARLFLFPTTAEIDPISLKDALAFGLPIVSSTIKPITDLVGGKGCAILVDSYDVNGIAEAITMVLDDDSMRQSMSKSAKALARTYSYEDITKQTLDLYEKLVQNKK
jgi:glycosyltransferase involved in cell wall biosynthesis